MGNQAFYNRVGIIYVNHIKQQVSITSSTFTDNYVKNLPYSKSYSSATNKAGHFYFDEALDVVIDRCTFDPYSNSVLAIIITAVEGNEANLTSSFLGNKTGESIE